MAVKKSWHKLTRFMLTVVGNPMIIPGFDVLPISDESGKETDLGLRMINWERSTIATREQDNSRTTGLQT